MVNRKTLIGVISGVVALGLVVGVSAVWPGLDAQEAPPTDGSVWALQTSDGRRYARVNTGIGELDTVRNVANPSSIVQTEAGAFLFSDTNSRVVKINEAQPADLDEDALRAAGQTPAGTQDVVTAGDYVVYRTDTGGVFYGLIDRGTTAQLNPNADKQKDASPSPSSSSDTSSTTPDKEKVPDYASLAVAVNDKGVIFSYSAVDKQVMRFSIPDEKILGTDPLTGVGDEPQLSAVGDTWFLVDGSSKLFKRGTDQVQKLSLAANVMVARATSTGNTLYIADEGGLVGVPVNDAKPERIVGGPKQEVGSPARPVTFGSEPYAAWLSGDGGRMWRASSGESTLDYGGKTLGDTRTPRFFMSSQSMILNETRSGWVWTMPQGALVPSSQDWTLDKEIADDAQVSDVQATLVLDPKPPIAEPDAFGVRAGGITSLPVMLNDHDPNEDVLSIIPSSVSGLDPKFGTATLTDGGGRLSVTVSPDATGTASFTYAVTDGTTPDGLNSEPTTVTLTVTPPQKNAAPAFCGTAKCLAPWPAPQVKPGGTITVPALNGWVDPDGDPLVLLSVDNPSDIGSAAVTASGEVVYQHPDRSTTDTTVVELGVTVADVRGAKATKTLKVTVTPNPTIQANSFTVVNAIDADLSIDVSPHVSATAGDIRLEAVRVLDDGKADATVASGGTAFDFAAKEPGQYRVAYTVVDTAGAKSDATVRITVLPADAPAELATSPVVAFVRPQEDATIDVFDAVSNPTRRVLLLNDVQSTTVQGASMQVDAVGQQFLRVTGSTADGEPGILGTVDYVISDGSESASARIPGQATVYLLPPTTDFAPIAVDDFLTVRAGAQIDIPVLENDVAPSGAALTLDPSKVTSSARDALAFASGSLIRYLAPKQPGQYTVDYAVYSAGAPSRLDNATVHVTVIGDDTNRAPRPKLLEGRVLAGQQVTIPFDSFGVDPDGDDVIVDRVMTQPAKGAAVLAPDGSGIIYSAPAGTKGQFTFTYRVTDSFGEHRTGTVRVGVLDEQSNPSPVTFTDYVQVQVGAKSTINVTPLNNDVDPTGGKLTLTHVAPNLAPQLDTDTANPEYERWKSLITSANDTTIVFGAGTEPGTMSFLYDVESSSGNTGRGLIVIKVVREAVPDYPVVTDTALTVENRDQFTKGVNVLSGKVVWSGGNAGDLKVALWGDPKDVTLTGASLSGALPKTSRIVPFSVSGTATDGTTVTSYAFLRVPGDDDLTLALKANVKPFDVVEKESVDFDMAAITAIPRGGTLEVSPESVGKPTRPEATCTVTGTKVTYAAGEGAPWADSCVINVRLTGQDQWTALSVPIRVTALAPVPVLKPASLTVSPGESATFDLATMVSWQGRDDWANLVLVADAPGPDFTLTQSGTKVTLRAADTAVPGRESASVISVTSHPNVAPSRLTVRVGAAPSTLPRAGTVQLSCSQAAGNSCSVNVVGASGEVNPLPGTPLVLESVASTSACTGVSFSASGSTVTASWSSDAPGAACTAAFVLRDAQGRTTNGDRQGLVYLDLKGYPRPPSSVQQVRYDDGRIGLAVDPGQARASYPGISGFQITSNGATVATCSADGACPDFSAPNGEQRTYQAVAINEVGASKSAVSTVAWAYRPPVAPAGFSAVPVPNGAAGGRVQLSFSGVDVQSKTLIISSPTGPQQSINLGNGQTNAELTYDLGSNTAVPVTVTAVSKFEVPPGTGPTGAGNPTKQVTTNGIGAPTGASLGLTKANVDVNTATVTATMSGNPGGTGAGILYGVVSGTGNCQPTEQSGTFTFSVARNQQYPYTGCAVSTYNGAPFGDTVRSENQITVSGDLSAPSGYTYTVSPTPSVEGTSVFWRISTLNKPVVPNGWHEEIAGYPSDLYGTPPNIRAWWVSDVIGGDKTDVAVASATGADRQYEGWWKVPQCQKGERFQVTASQLGVVDSSGLLFTLADGTTTAMPASGKVPNNAVSVTGVTVSFAPGSGLTPYTYTMPVVACG